MVKNAMDQAFSGLVQVRNQVPPVPDDQSSTLAGTAITAVVDGLLPGSTPTAGLFMSSADEGRASSAQTLANTVMETVYKPVMNGADENTPQLPGPIPPSGDPSAPPKEKWPGGGSGNGRPTPGTGGGDPTTADGEGTGLPEDSTTSDDTDPASAEVPQNALGDPTAGTGTTPASATPTATTPSSTSPAGVGAGGPGMGGGGLGSGGGLAGLPTGGGPGSSQPGRVPGATAAAAGGGVPGTGQPGRAGMPGMMPGRGGGGKDDETETKAPDYLRGIQEELLPLDQKMVPPVIGGDYDQR